jgi:predicted nucleic acid-binding Zn ribbon protein
VVEASAWATKLRYREPEVLEGLAGAVGSGVVRALRIRVEPSS